jgi:hypothetical protein
MHMNAQDIARTIKITATRREESYDSLSCAYTKGLRQAVEEACEETQIPMEMAELIYFIFEEVDWNSIMAWADEQL